MNLHNQVRTVALQYMRSPSIDSARYNREFIGLFGAKSEVVTIIFCKLRSQLQSKARIEHVLMGFHFSACYPKDIVGAAFFNVDEKAYNKWHWTVVYELCMLEDVIVWEDRKALADPEDTTRVYVTVDGIDCYVPEPHPFDPEMYSHKLNHAGLKYEIVISIRGGDICFINGGVKCGVPDITLSRMKLFALLGVGEMAIGDEGYNDNQNHFLTPLHAEDADSQAINARMRRLRARHETANARMEKFQILKTYRGSLDRHKYCFKAVAIIVQLAIRNRQPLFDKE